MSDDDKFVFVGKAHPTKGEIKRSKTSKGTVRYKGSATGVGKDSSVNSRTMTVYASPNPGDDGEKKPDYPHMDWFLDAWDDGEVMTFTGFTYEGTYEGKPYTSYNVIKVERGDTVGDAPSSSASTSEREPGDWSDPEPSPPEPQKTAPPAQQQTSTAKETPVSSNIAVATWALTTLIDNLDKFPELQIPNEEGVSIIEDKAERGKWLKASATGLSKVAREVAEQL